MLGLYLKSVIIYWIILFAALKIAKMNMKLNNINLKDYTGKESTGENGVSLLLIAAVPLYRFAMLLMALFLCVTSKETLDKIFKKEDK